MHIPLHIFGGEMDGVAKQWPGIFRDRDEPGVGLLADGLNAEPKEGKAYTQIATVLGLEEKDDFLLI